MAFVSERDLEIWALERLEALGYRYARASEVSPEHHEAQRTSYRDAVLEKRLRAAVERLNPGLPETAVTEVVSVVRDVRFGRTIEENERLHGLLVNGVPITVIQNGEERGDVARLVDWDDAENDWLVVNQFEIVDRETRFPDVTLFLNGLPVVVVSLKGVEGGSLESAWNQLEEYKQTVPTLYRTNALSVISDGVTARYGSLSADFERFMRWRTVDGETLVEDQSALALQTLIDGLLAPATLLPLIRRFTVFEDDGRGPVKKIAGYHQFHAAQKGHRRVLEAVQGNGKAGVMWHTQGSGKSLLMAFFGGMLMHDATLGNPTLVVLTDRNDLDNQLFGTFGRCRELLGEEPQQAESVEGLKRLLDRDVGGVIFTTIQKFQPDRGEEEFPELTARNNVIVFVDEAHRTQYGFSAKITDTGERRYGLAHQVRRAIPNASFVGFTGTPIELVNANTLTVFGDYIDVYDITQAVEDGATVPIYYEGRIARVDLEIDVEELDETFEEVTDDVEETTRDAIRRKWAGVEALVGAENRLETVVDDILQHFDGRLTALDGKAMIVCMSRRIAVDVYNRIVARRPGWHAETDDAGAVKVVITGSSSDPEHLQPHIRSKARQEVLRNRYRDPADPLRLVIVCDMWLTGFDAPCMHTLYMDKPMKGHGLMQAITRVNRVFRDKPAGLVVDYIGLAADLKSALAAYSQSDQDKTGIDEAEAVAALMTALDVVRSIFHGFDYQSALTGGPSDRVNFISAAMDYVLGGCGAQIKATPDESEDVAAEGKRRFNDAMAALVKAFKLASGTSAADEVKDEVGLFVAVQTAIRKLEAGSGRGPSPADTDFAIQQLVNRAVGSTEVVDILEASGVERPDISVLSEDFLLEIQKVEHKNLAVEALKKILNGEISSRLRTNVTKHERFSERLETAMRRYHNRSVDALQVIQELIQMARDLSAEDPDNLSNAERAFYDALAQNESAAELMQNDELRALAAALVKTVRENAGVDWWRRRNVRANLRRFVRRTLRQYGYPPDLEADAVKRVMRQAEAMAEDILQPA